MKKEAYYFSHDGNAQDDPKCIILIEDMGMEGIGIFWCLVEKLRSEAEFILPLSVINAFAMRWHTSAEKVKKVINDYNLFKIENGYFYSERLKSSMNEKSEKARQSASYRWSASERKRAQANGMRSNAIKGKEKKEKNNTISPNGVKQPQPLIDSKGNPQLDHNGNPVRSLKGMVF